jgi:hypothetical protein
MTDRIRILTVTLDNDYRSDDVESVLNAIRMVKGVALVSTRVVEGGDYMNRQIATMELRQKVFSALDAALPLFPK